MSFHDLLSNDNFKKSFDKRFLENDDRKKSSTQWSNTLQMIDLKQQLETASDEKTQTDLKAEIKKITDNPDSYDQAYIDEKFKPKGTPTDN